MEPPIYDFYWRIGGFVKKTASKNVFSPVVFFWVEQFILFYWHLITKRIDKIYILL
jgi:hypothetical protein